MEGSQAVSATATAPQAALHVAAHEAQCAWQFFQKCCHDSATRALLCYLSLLSRDVDKNDLWKSADMQRVLALSQWFRTFQASHILSLDYLYKTFRKYILITIGHT